MATMLSEIESNAAVLGLRLNEMKPNKERQEDFFNHFSASFVVEGEMAPVMNLMHTLQSPPYNLFVDEFSLDKISEKSSLLRCNLKVSRYLIPQ